MDEHRRSRTFEEFYARYWRRVVRYARQFSANDAEDIAQEVMARAMFRFPEVDETDPTPWLRVVARRIAVDVHRKQKSSPYRDDLIEASTPPEPDLASAAAVHADVRRRLGEALRLLRPADRELLLAHDIDGVPGPVLARRLGITPQAARARVLRARRRLRRAYRRVGGPDRLYPLGLLALAGLTGPMGPRLRRAAVMAAAVPVIFSPASHQAAAGLPPAGPHPSPSLTPFRTPATRLTPTPSPAPTPTPTGSVVVRPLTAERSHSGATSSPTPAPCTVLDCLSPGLPSPLPSPTLSPSALPVVSP